MQQQVDDECIAILRECLRAFNVKPNFSYGDSTSYQLAARIERFLESTSVLAARMAEAERVLRLIADGRTEHGGFNFDALAYFERTADEASAVNE
jgi:hypothetical protein